MNRLAPPPLALYVHIPWCLKKCPYCDFNSHAVSGKLPESDYIDQLVTDLKADLYFVQGRTLSSIFIGGGTPSLFSPDSFETLLADINDLVPFSDDIEITLEANPGTFEMEKFRAYRQAGINRLSIGIQSFDDGFLKALGRVHDEKEARQAAGQVHDAGFDNFNLDLMFGLPGQNTKQALADLETALACNPAHLSWYQLTIEPNTVFYSRPPSLPDDDALATMQEAGISLLKHHGLHQYEVSAFSQEGKRSRHNLNYWQFGDYLGIGAGAHGKITLADEGRLVRTRKRRQPGHYLERGANLTAEVIDIPAAELPLEFMMNVLRLREGCDESLFPERTGLALETLSEPVLALRQRGLLEEDRFVASAKGFLHLNSVLDEFLPSADRDPQLIPALTSNH